MKQHNTHRMLVLLAALVVCTGGLLTGDLAVAGDQEEGAKLYKQRCASCHGEDGKANTPIAQALNPKPRNHAEGAYMNGLSDEHLTKVIKEGGSAVGRSPLMPPQADLNPTQIRQIVSFVRSLAVPAYKGN